MKKKGNYCVYLHTVNKTVSGYNYKKYYVGITNNIKRRWAYNGANYKGQIFYRAIEKYGWDNIKHTILYDNLTKEEAMQKEKEMIIKYHSKLGDRGYNVTDGGEGMSEKRKNAKNVYCLENKTFYHSNITAEKYTCEPYCSINTKCDKHYDYIDMDIRKKNGEIVGIRKGYKWCFSTEAYKYLPYAIKSTKFIVDINTGICYPKNYLEHKVINKRIIVGRGILTIEKYYEYLDRGLIQKRQYFMYLSDYLYLFDYAKMCDFD